MGIFPIPFTHIHIHTRIFKTEGRTSPNRSSHESSPIMSNILINSLHGFKHHLHNRTASVQLLQYPWQQLHSQLLQLIILAILLIIALVLVIILVAALVVILAVSLLWLVLLMSALLRLVMVTALLLAWLVGIRWRHRRWSTGEVDVHPSGVFFRRVLQSQLLAHLFNSRLDLLDVVDGVVAFAYDAIYFHISVAREVPRGRGLTHASESVHSAAHIVSSAPEYFPPPLQTVHANQSYRLALALTHYSL